MATDSHAVEVRAFLSKLVGVVPEEFTPEWLDSVVQMATAFTGEVYPATRRGLMDAATHAAGAMRAQGVKSSTFAGMLRANPFKAGQKVRIPAGAKLFSRGETNVSLRARTVILRRVGDGFSYIERGSYILKQPIIVWAAGGYWVELELGQSGTPTAA